MAAASIWAPRRLPAPSASGHRALIQPQSRPQQGATTIAASPPPTHLDVLLPVGGLAVPFHGPHVAAVGPVVGAKRADLQGCGSERQGTSHILGKIV
jgi:hypothetical protein